MTETITVVLTSQETYTCYNLEFEVHYSEDPNYGADADGNRGTHMTSIDEVVLSHCEPPLSDEDKNLLEEAEDIAVEKFFGGTF